RAARAAMAGTDLPLTVDANGAYQWPGDERALRALDAAGLLYIEQPLAPEELVGHARPARALHTPPCLPETPRHAGIPRAHPPPARSRALPCRDTHPLVGVEPWLR